ncbi:TPA: radical SAM protein [Candidatus Galligastranaerophilus gallistercoris]|nr:radical SAM protein [Candidatus Galligastranaerophilus gallistercoris]
MSFINHSYLFDLFRNVYADISYKSFLSKTGEAVIPLRYFLEVTYRCNLNCPYCYIGTERKKDELSYEEWVRFISQIPRYAFITLVGGEPFIREDFIPIMEYAAKRVFGKVNVVSNGLMLDNQAIDSIIKSKIILLSVSLDGCGKTHDINRNKDGIFDKIINNLENVNLKRKNKSTMIDIKTIVLKNNLEDIYKLYEYCTKQGFEFLSVSFLRNNNLKQNAVLRDSFEPVFYEPSYDIDPYFDIEHFLDVYKRICSLSRKSKTRIRFSPKFEGGSHESEIKRINDFFNPKDKNDLKRHPSEIYFPCKYPYSNMMINPSGDVYPCLSFKIGNIKEMSIKELFNLPKYKCFRKNLKYSKSFSSCQMCCDLKVKDKR